MKTHKSQVVSDAFVSEAEDSNEILFTSNEHPSATSDERSENKSLPTLDSENKSLPTMDRENKSLATLDSLQNEAREIDSRDTSKLHTSEVPFTIEIKLEEDM